MMTAIPTQDMTPEMWNQLTPEQRQVYIENHPEAIRQPLDSDGWQMVGEDLLSQMGQFAQQMNAWGMNMFQQQLGMIEPIISDLRSYAGKVSGWADEDRAHYNNVFRSLEDGLAADARNFNTAGRRELEAGRATAEVSAKFQAERENAQRRLETMGVDPSQVRAQALDTQMRMGEAAAEAGAANQARRYVEDTGRQLRMQAIGVGQANADRALKEQQLAGQFQEAAGNLGNAAYANAPRFMSAGTQAMGLPVQQWGNVGDFMLTRQGQRQQLAQDRRDYNWNRLQNIIGTVGTVFGMSGGGAVPPQGGALPAYDGNGGVEGAGGPKQDMVPARLSDGEYVSDADTVRWLGEKHFVNLRDKVRKEMATERAINPPTLKPAIPGA